MTDNEVAEVFWKGLYPQRDATRVETIRFSDFLLEDGNED